MKVLEESTDHLTIEADVKAASVLVVTDNYTGGWRVVPLGGSASDVYEIIPANYALRGVPLAPGHHRLRMEYRPASFVLGVWLSLAGVAAWMAAAGVLLCRRRRPGDSGAKQPSTGGEATS